MLLRLQEKAVARNTDILYEQNIDIQWVLVYVYVKDFTHVILFLWRSVVYVDNKLPENTSTCFSIIP